MVIHPILGIITMGILNPIDGRMTIPFYEKTNHVLTGSVRTQPLSHTPCAGGGGMRLKLAKILHTAVCFDHGACVTQVIVECSNKLPQGLMSKKVSPKVPKV